GMPRIVASSSTREKIEMNLQTTGTARYFDDVVCGADVAHSRHSPDIFLEAARGIGLPADDCLVLEDRVTGVRAGHGAGAVTVMVPDLAEPTQEILGLCHRCCHDLHEVLAVLKDENCNTQNKRAACRKDSRPPARHIRHCTAAL